MLVPIPLPSESLRCLISISGALGIMIANPTDLVKVRLQAEGKLPPGVPRRYSGALNAYSTIVKQVVHLTWEKEQYGGISLTISCVSNSVLQLLGRICGSLDWSWTQCCTKCYHKCC